MRSKYRQIDHYIFSVPENLLLNSCLLELNEFKQKWATTGIVILTLPRLFLLCLYMMLLMSCLSTLLFPRITLAAEWSVEPTISLFLGHDDNPTLTTGTHESVASASLYPRIKWGRATETSNISLGLLLGATEYSGNQVPDSDVQILTLNSSVQTTERTRWALDGEYRRNILFESIEGETGTGNLRDTDVGLVAQKVRRESLNALPSWTYALSELSSMNIAYEINDVNFSNVAGTNLEDYKNHYLRATYSYRISQLDNLNFALAHSAFRPDVSNIKTDTSQVLIGISHAYTETTHGRLFVGVGESSEKTPTVTNDTSNYILEAGLEQRSELTTVDGVISRDVQPSGAGRSVLSNQFRLDLQRKISPMMSLNIRANIFRNKVLEGVDPNIDRRYYELIPGLSWQWTPSWAFGLEYQYRKQKYDAITETAKSNATYATVYYSWAKQVTSR